MAKSLIDKFIYRITKKPEHYVEVKNPPETEWEKLFRPQDARQMQYNRWSRRFKVYSGSYLPENDKRLLTKGWEEAKKSRNTYETEYTRRSTKQKVLYHGRHINSRRGKVELTHYHWLNQNIEGLTKKQRLAVYYYDKYGDPCKRKSKESHLKPF